LLFDLKFWVVFG